MHGSCDINPIMRTNKTATGLATFILIVSLLFAFAPTGEARIKAQPLPYGDKISSNWTVDISHRDLNGGAPKIGDTIEYTLNVNGITSDPNYGFAFSSYTQQDFSEFQVTYLSTLCGVDLSRSNYGPNSQSVWIDINDRYETGCPYVNNFTAKFTGKLQNMPKGALVNNLTYAHEVYGGCDLHNCWPQNSVTDSTRFRMNYYPYRLQAI